MPKLYILQREISQGLRTFGSFRSRTKHLCFTLEETPLMVPPAFYVLEPHGWEPETTLKKKKCWALVGEHCSHQQDPLFPHAAKLIHVGNDLDDTEGCVLPGLSKNSVEVIESGLAMEVLRHEIGNNLAYLLVKGPKT